MVPETHPLVVAPSQQRRPGGPADGGGVKGVVADAPVPQPGECGGVNLTAEGVGLGEAHIVNQHDKHVGRVRPETVGLLAPLVLGFLQGRPGDTG
jgi:hypothetical protein